MAALPPDPAAGYMTPPAGRSPQRFVPPSVRSAESQDLTQLIPLTVNSAANSSQVGADVALVAGTLSVVQPVGVAVPRGRFYLELQIFESGLKNNLICTPWSGYVTGSPRPSFPNIRVETGWVARIRISQASQGGVTAFTVNLQILPDTLPVGPGFFFYEVPGDGPGEPRGIALADPAAGSDYANVTVPAGVMWRLRGFLGALTTSGTAANRHHTNVATDGGSVDVGYGPASDPQGATLTVNYRGEVGAVSTGVATAIAGQVVSVALVSAPLLATFIVLFATLNLQAGDDWGAGKLSIEEWAVP